VTSVSLLALSVAVPRGVRARILRDRGPLVLFGAASTSLDQADRPVCSRLQLGRHGFVLARTGAGFGDVDEEDLRPRMVIAAAVRQRVVKDESGPAAGGR
jgi:hypothetical protein